MCLTHVRVTLFARYTLHCILCCVAVTSLLYTTLLWIMKAGLLALADYLAWY